MLPGPGTSVRPGFAAVFVDTIGIEPPCNAVLHFALPVLVHPVADRITGIGQRTGFPARTAVVVVGIEVNLATIAGNPVAVCPSLLAGLDEALPTGTAILGMLEDASLPACPAVLHIRHQVNAVIGREDPALGETRAAGAGRERCGCSYLWEGCHYGFCRS